MKEATQAVVNTLAPASTRGQARALLEGECADSLDRDEPRTARAQWGLAWVEFWAGRWELAAEYADRAFRSPLSTARKCPRTTYLSLSSPFIAAG